jgi:predicted methyltransferase
MRHLLTLLACLASVPLVAAAPAELAQVQPVDPALGPVLAHERRAGDRDRDEFRKPAETLAFFRVRPGMTVVDFTPGGGWWTRVLVPYLGEGGRYIALNPDVSKQTQMARYYGDTATTFPPKVAEWTGVPANRVGAYNTDGMPAELNGTVDRVLIFRAMHNLFRTGMLHGELTAIHALLKPDGMLGIEQHRAKPNAPAAYTNGSRGYMREKDVIALVEAYGFELVAKSEVNANAKDPANHPEGVWELPPNLRTKREELKAIGESDRMTLLFRKRA